MSKEALDERRSPADTRELAFNTTKQLGNSLRRAVALALFGIAMTILLGVELGGVRRQ